MRTVTIEMLPGRSPEQKERLVRKVAREHRAIAGRLLSAPRDDETAGMRTWSISGEIRVTEML